MIKAIKLGDGEWDAVVRTFPNHDVYYLSGYADAFVRHGDGEAFLVYWESGTGTRALSVVMKRDVATAPQLAGKVEAGTYFDFVTPYGYGGFIFDGVVDESAADLFSREYEEFCRRERIVTEFVRFHPVLKNSAERGNGLFTPRSVGHTIALDLSSREIIDANIISQCRNKIRKARKAGVEIRHGQGMDLFDAFIPIYNETMNRDSATPYYYFGRDFYESIASNLRENYELFYAVLNGEIIAASIMLFGNGQMHYHLSGGKSEYRNLAAINLLLYEAACWGCERGLKTLHLGGGVGADENGGLFKFKASFNRNSDYTFSVGNAVFDEGVYSTLIELSGNAGVDSAFFPLYRYTPPPFGGGKSAAR